MYDFSFIFQYILHSSFSFIFVPSFHILFVVSNISFIRRILIVCWGCYQVFPVEAMALLVFYCQVPKKRKKRITKKQKEQQKERIKVIERNKLLTHFAAQTWLADSLHNVENPELYAVFPYPLYGVGLPSINLYLLPPYLLPSFYSFYLLF